MEGQRDGFYILSRWIEQPRIRKLDLVFAWSEQFPRQFLSKTQTTKPLALEHHGTKENEKDLF